MKEEERKKKPVSDIRFKSPARLYHYNSNELFHTNSHQTNKDLNEMKRNEDN